jgi:membrane protein involved in colicin uptake
MTEEEKKKAEEEKKKAEETAATAKAAAEAAAKAAPFATFETADAFNKRMEREARSILKAKGIDPDKIDEQMAALKKLQEDQAKAEEAQKSEIQKAAEAKAKAEADAKSAMGAAEAAQMKAHLYKTFAEQGVKNFDYAFYAVTEKLSNMKDTEELDEVDFIKKMMSDPAQAAALGVVAAPAAQTQGVTTTGAGAVPDPKPGSPAGDPKAGADAFSKSPEQFRADTGTKYGFTPPV